MLVYHRQTFQLHRRFQIKAAVKALSWMPKKSGDRILAIGGGLSDSRLILWNVSDNKIVAECYLGSQFINVFWNPNNTNQLITAQGSSSEIDEKTNEPCDLYHHQIVLHAWNKEEKKIQVLHSFGSQDLGRIVTFTSTHQGKSFLALYPTPEIERLLFYQVFDSSSSKPLKTSESRQSFQQSPFKHYSSIIR